ncbi:MAG: TolC family protein [Desulfobacterales bacterium]
MLKMFMAVSARLPLILLLCLLLNPTIAATDKTDHLNTSETVKSVKTFIANEAEQMQVASNAVTRNPKIKVLTGTGDIRHAESLALRLENTGYEVDAVDAAPRSDFENHTLYFAEGYDGKAKEIVQRLNLTNVSLKPLSWQSIFDLIIVAAGPIDEIAPAAVDRSVRAVADDADEKSLKIKVLSGDGDLGTARKAAEKIKNAGYRPAPVDYAPRSDFKQNTIYFSKKYKAQAERTADVLNMPNTRLKPLNWQSDFDMIVVTVNPEKIAGPGPEQIEQDRHLEKIISLHSQITRSLDEAHERFTDQDFSGANEYFADSAKSTQKLRRLLEKAFLTNKNPKSSESGRTDETLEDAAPARILVLSRDIDLGHAKKVADRIADMGYEKPAVDYALRSDLKTQTIYFADSYQKAAYDIASHLKDDPDPIPLRWTSDYDVILVTAEAPEPGRALRLLEKYRKEEKEIVEQINGQIAQGRELSEKGRFAESMAAYSRAEEMIETAQRLCEKSLYQENLLALAKPAKPDVKQLPEPAKITTLTLEEAVKLAVQRSARIQQAEQNVNSAIEEKKTAISGFFPKGTAEYQFTHLNEEPTTSFTNPFAPVVPGQTIEFTVGSQNLYEWNITLTQPLFTGFALSSQYRLGELGVEAARTQRNLAVIDLVRDVKVAYFSLLMSKAGLRVAEDAVKNLESVVRDTEQFYNQGMIPYNDLLKSKVALANVVQQRETALASKKISMSALNTLLEFDINRQTEVEDILSIPPVSYELPNLFHEAQEHRPELKLIRNAVNSLDQGIRLAKSAYYPKFAVAGYYEQTGDNWRADENDFGPIYNAAVILNGTWDFFEGGKTRSEVAKYRYDKKAVMNQYQTAENGIRLEVKNAFSDLKVADKNIITAQESLVQARENWRITNLQYKEQIATSTDVLDARVDLTRAEFNYYRSLYGYMISLSELQRAMGKGRIFPEADIGGETDLVLPKKAG